MSVDVKSTKISIFDVVSKINTKQVSVNLRNIETTSKNQNLGQVRQNEMVVSKTGQMRDPYRGRYARANEAIGWSWIARFRFRC